MYPSNKIGTFSKVNNNNKETCLSLKSIAPHSIPFSILLIANLFSIIFILNYIILFEQSDTKFIILSFGINVLINFFENNIINI